MRALILCLLLAGCRVYYPTDGEIEPAHAPTDPAVLVDGGTELHPEDGPSWLIEIVAAVAALLGVGGFGTYKLMARRRK